MTAEVHADFGRLKVRMGDQTDALNDFKQSFIIYESYLGKNALETAKSALQVATILEEQGNDAESYVYASKAA